MAKQMVVGSTEELQQSILGFYQWMTDNPGQMPDLNKFFTIITQKSESIETLGETTTESLKPSS